MTFDCPPAAAMRDCQGCERLTKCIQSIRDRHYQRYNRATIREEPIPAECAPVIDADREQENRFHLRDLK